MDWNAISFRRRVAHAITVALCCSPFTTTMIASASERLLSPFNLPLPTYQGKICPNPPPVVMNINGIVPYSDNSYSIVDDDKLKEDQFVYRGVYALHKLVNEQTDQFLESRQRDKGAASCALELMDNWAQASALTGDVNFQGSAHRMWALNSLAMSLLVIRDEPSLDHAQLERVTRWLGLLGWLTKESHGHSTNNHLYWAAAAAAAAAIASNDGPLFKWAMSVAQASVDDIQPDGTLPLELMRKQMAMRYHVFALEPLVLLAEYGAANGVNLYAMNDHAIMRLAKLVMRNISEPDELAKMTGIKQMWNNVPTGELVVWAEPLYTRFQDREMGELLKRARPAKQGYWGGNSTLQFGSSIN